MLVSAAGGRWVRDRGDCGETLFRSVEDRCGEVVVFGGPMGLVGCAAGLDCGDDGTIGCGSSSCCCCCCCCVVGRETNVAMEGDGAMATGGSLLLLLRRSANSS